ncbi:hypothetical protein P879_02910 [Paragonimus westermani]|uniref:EF-hand domain-containing protein n=1 Tax=Paragonimus westermani TaxID=34504 RepID=A0A8T0DIT9_9TREM|nr:hypothetical protein P879_02910 [Paragonimus westermani]
MDPFIEVFFYVDSDRCGNITVKNLETYVLKNNLDKSMVTKWCDLFDPENTGKITLEKFCDVLGLKAADVIKKREEFYQNQVARLGDDVQVIFQNMPLEQQVLITDEVRLRASRITSNDQIQQFTVDMKQFLDEHFGPSWQVLVVDGNFWLTHTYIPNSSFQFNMQDRSFAFWKITE